ncbi:MAG: tRNA (adenosine(37)-N6)-dimethylallyltransferase MiaA [Magnetococcus sp. DMHC-6]
MPSPLPFNLLVLLGPTASGKTALAVEAALQLQGEIISADSRQVYRGMDIGTGKDLNEYGAIPYHMIDILNPDQPFNLFEFQSRFNMLFPDILSRNRLPCLVGGTGLYVEAVLMGYPLKEAPSNPERRQELERLDLEALQKLLLSHQPSLHNRTDLLEKKYLIRAIEIQESPLPPLPAPTLAIKPIVFGLRFDKTTLKQRITNRLRHRMAQGLIQEVEQLLAQGYSHATLEAFGLEYRFVSQYVRGALHNRNDLFQKLNSAIHQYAKRQLTWFARMERHGIVIHWLDGEKKPLAQLLHIIDRI